jgi:hypothetical protein
VTTRSILILIISLFVSACGGSSGGGTSNPPPPANVAPIANAGPDQSGISPGATVTLDGSGSSDADGDPLTYAWTLTTVPAGSAAALSDATAVGPTFDADLAGSYVAELVVNDGTVNSAPDTVTIVVEAAPPANTAPIADAGPDQSGISPGATVTLDGSGSSDADGDPLTYAWTLTSVPAGSTAVLSDATVVGPTFDADLVGSYVAQLVVNDGTVDSAPDTVTIVVEAAPPANQAPTADAGPDQPGIAEGATVTLDGSGSSDPDGDPLTYAWTLTTVPAGSAAVLGDATAVGPTFVADVVGTYVAELVVNDGTVDSAPDTVTITVDASTPTANAGPDQYGIAEGDTVTLDGAASSDPNGDPLTYAWTLTSVPTGSAAALSDATVVGPTFVADLKGSYVAQLVVNDGTVDSAPDEVTVTVGVHSYWTMEEGAGPTTADTVGVSDGTLVGATWTTGVSGNGLDFDGISAHVVIDNTPDLEITGTEITLMAWVYPRDASTSEDPGVPSGSRVISKRNDAGGADIYAMKLEDYRACFRLAPENTCQYSDHVLVFNEWVHVAMVYDGVDKRIYINGILDASSPEVRAAPIQSSSRPVLLGMREDEGRLFNGVLDEVQIYDRALSAAEVQAIHGAITPPLPGPGLRFTNITETAGTGGPRVGARGIMFAEVNNDSLPDFYLTNILDGEIKREYYFENVDGATFTELAVERGIDDADGSYGAVWADLDNDGDYDLFNGTTWGAANPSPGFPTNNNVYQNDGDATGFFTEVTSADILANATETRGVTAFDMDNDGDLDLYGASGGNTPGANEAYLNGLIGGAGAFDFTNHPDVALTTADVKNGVTDTDYDNDGDIDIIAANTTGQFRILDNDGTGTFAEVLPSTLGINDPAGTGITPADIDNDGDLDLLLTSQNLQSYLYRREPDGSVPLYVLQQTFINGWMGSFADLDNDGDLDLVFSEDFRSYINDGSGNFSFGQSLPVSSVVDARAIAFADIDSDGDLDFAVGGKGVQSDPDGRSVLIRNDIDADAGNWLRVELVSPTCQAGAFGARTRIYPDGEALTGTLLGMRESRGNHGYHAQNEQVLHFGLGSRASVDVVVDFLDGTQTIEPGVAANQRILVDECSP